MKEPTIKKFFHTWVAVDLNWTFFVAAEAKNLINLNRIILCVEVAIYLEDGKTKSKPGDVDVVFSNNTLHTLFSHAELYQNEKFFTAIFVTCIQHLWRLNFQLTRKAKTHGPNAKDIIIWRSRVEKINNLTSSLPALQKKRSAKFSSAVPSTLTFRTVRNFCFQM